MKPIIATRTAAPKPSPVVATDAAAEELDLSLRGLITAHEELLRLAAAHRSAISRADVRALTDIMNAQAAVVQRVSELEQQRQAAVAVLAKATAAGSGGTPKPTVSQLVRTLSDPMRSRLVALADRLREILNRLHAEQMALREAAETLSGHMEGLMRQVCRKLSHAGTYARSGVVDTSAPVVTALDVRS